MNRIIRTSSIIILALALLASCNKNMSPTSIYSPAQIAEAIISSQDSIAPLQPLLPDEEYYADYLADIYRLDAVTILDGAIYYASGMKADEIAIFRLADNSDAKYVKETLDKYRERRADAFTGYAPEQSAVLANGIVAAHGDYVALLVCRDPQKAQSYFIACFTDSPPEIDANIELLPREYDEASADPEPDKRESEPPVIIDETANDDYADDSTKDDEDATDNDDTAADDDTIAIDDDTAANDDDTAANDDDAVVNDDQVTANDDQTDGDAVGEDSATIDNGADGDKKQEKPEDNGMANGGIFDDKETHDDKPTGEKDDNPDSDDEEIDEAPADDGTTVLEDTYDPASILAAWRSGDMANLSSKNRSILEACIEVINAIIDDSMSVYDKELAINDWIVDWVSYDEETLSNAPNAKPDPDNDNPYGALFGQRAICSGYTSTFQLFMDLLGIECISVSGTYANTGEDHAWNMVRIDGEWYCVDVTWNDPIGPPSLSSKHRFFNVTSEFMRETGHQWDESTTPVADAGKLYFG